MVPVLIGKLRNMKIIITENQLNNFLKTQDIIRNAFEKGYSVSDISKYTSINKGLIYNTIEDYDFEIDCTSAYDILLDLFTFNHLSSEYNDGIRHIKLDLHNMTGTFYFEYMTEKCLLVGMATPFWVGDCMLPIDSINCQFFDDKKPSRIDEDISGDYIIPIPTHFNSISELKQWFNEKYFKLLIPYSEKLIEIYDKNRY